MYIVFSLVQRKLDIILHDIRSSHNVGSIFRTADGLGVNRVFLSGYTPFPISNNDNRLPHLALKATRQINKTALGATQSVKWSHYPDIGELLKLLKSDGYKVIAL